MSFSINTNLGALKAFNALAKVNSEAQIAQFKLATGKRINSVADDTSGFKVGKSLQSKTMIQKSQLNNASAAKDFLATAETALLQVNDLLIQISAKYADAQDPSKSKDAIADDIRSIASEIDSILKTTKFNDTNLLAQADGSALTSSGTFDVGTDFSTDFASDTYLKADVLKTALHGGTGTELVFYEGSEYNVTDAYSGGDQTSVIEAQFADGSTEIISIDLTGATTLGDVEYATMVSIGSLDMLNGGTNSLSIVGSTNGDENIHRTAFQSLSGSKITSLAITSGFDILSALGAPFVETTYSYPDGGLMNTDTNTVIAAASDITEITDNVRNSLGRIGNLTQSLDYKSDFLTASITNNQSSISRLFDTDMAKEQLNASKGTLASNVGISILSQMNFAPQQLLQLLG